MLYIILYYKNTQHNIFHLNKYKYELFHYRATEMHTNE